MKKGSTGYNIRLLIPVLVSVLVGLAPALVTSATINGTATFDGTPPAPKKIKVTKDQKKCGTEQVSEALVIGKGNGIQNVVVSIVNVPAVKPASPTPKKVEINQNGCRFVPHVAVLPVGAKLKMRNSDGISHNMHTFSKINPPINKAQPGFKKTMTIRTLKKPETIKLKCDFHGWMGGWIVVTDNPYTVVTDAAGQFELPDLPAGTYTLKFWHETLGKTSQEITVQDGATATVQVTMGSK